MSIELNKEKYKELFDLASDQEEILDIAGEILTETVELLIDLGINAEVIKNFVEFAEVEYTKLENSVTERTVLSEEELNQLKIDKPELF